MNECVCLYLCVLINWLPSLVSAPFIILTYNLHVCVFADGYSTISANEKSNEQFHCIDSIFHPIFTVDCVHFSLEIIYLPLICADGKGWRYKLKFIMNLKKKSRGLNARLQKLIISHFHNFQIKFNEIKMIQLKEKWIFNVSFSDLDLNLKKRNFFNEITSMKPLNSSLFFLNFLTKTIGIRHSEK